MLPEPKPPVATATNNYLTFSMACTPMEWPTSTHLVGDEFSAALASAVLLASEVLFLRSSPTHTSLKANKEAV